MRRNDTENNIPFIFGILAVISCVGILGSAMFAAISGISAPNCDPPLPPWYPTQQDCDDKSAENIKNARSAGIAMGCFVAAFLIFITISGLFSK